MNRSRVLFLQLLLVLIAASCTTAPSEPESAAKSEQFVEATINGRTVINRLVNAPPIGMYADFFYVNDNRGFALVNKDTTDITRATFFNVRNVGNFYPVIGAISETRKISVGAEFPFVNSSRTVDNALFALTQFTNERATKALIPRNATVTSGKMTITAFVKPEGNRLGRVEGTFNITSRFLLQGGNLDTTLTVTNGRFGYNLILSQ